METVKKLLDKITDGTKREKDRWLVIVLAGVLLCVIAMPARRDDTKSDISNTIHDTVDTSGETEAAAYRDGADGDYAAYWENRLEEALRYVEGTGQVRVLITLRESERRIVEKDGPEEYSDTGERDAAGGSRTTGESRIEKSTVYTVDETGREVPYVTRTTAPVVEGVVVIAQGAGERAVRDNIIRAIQVLFDLDANKITIVKMKNNQ